MTTLKIGITKKNPKHDEFMDEYHATTQGNPLDHRARVYGHSVAHLSDARDTIHIHDIRSFQHKGGHGTKHLKHITDLADKHKVKLSLHAVPYDDGIHGKMSPHKLKSWYMEHGFRKKHEDGDVYMERNPK